MTLSHYALYCWFIFVGMGKNKERCALFSFINENDYIRANVYIMNEKIALLRRYNFWGSNSIDKASICLQMKLRSKGNILHSKLLTIILKKS